jgi:ferritin-like metal-binding protein YciE
MMTINHNKHSFMSEQHNAGTNPKLQEFFVTSLEQLYWAETHLVSVLTTMSKAATDPSLKQAFDLHSQQTTQHKERLDKVFNLLNLPAKSEPSIGLQGLFNEGWQVIDETGDGSALRDVALIVAAQKFEHYEIACYGSLITLAKTIGQTEIAKILVPTLNEEKETDESLLNFMISQSTYNIMRFKEPGIYMAINVQIHCSLLQEYKDSFPIVPILLDKIATGKTMSLKQRVAANERLRNIVSDITDRQLPKTVAKKYSEQKTGEFIIESLDMISRYLKDEHGLTIQDHKRGNKTEIYLLNHLHHSPILFCRYSQLHLLQIHMSSKSLFCLFL